MDRKRLNSSKLRSIGYDERAQTLEIEFTALHSCGGGAPVPACLA